MQFIDFARILLYSDESFPYFPNERYRNGKMSVEVDGTAGSTSV